MCEPLSMIAAATSLGGSLLSGFGALSGGRSAAKSGKIQNTIQQSNADLALRQGVFEAGRARDEATRMADAAGAAYSASGVDRGFGGAAWAQAWSAAAGEQDAQILTARGQGQAAQHLQQGAAAMAAGEDARRAGNLSFATSILQGVGSFAKMTGATPTLSPTAGASASVPTGDPWGSMRWGYTGSTPNFWSR